MYTCIMCEYKMRLCRGQSIRLPARRSLVRFRTGAEFPFCKGGGGGGGLPDAGINPASKYPGYPQVNKGSEDQVLASLYKIR